MPTANEAGTQRVYPNTVSTDSNGSATMRVSATPMSTGPNTHGNPLDEGHTVSVVRKKTGIDPVVGWIVCVEGPDKGRDFRIRSEKNSVGRSDTMDISISGDETISRSDHAFIVYDPKRNIFRIQAGLSRGLVYLNDEEVISSDSLKPYDTINLGDSTFIFVPFCGEEFQWKKETKNEE